MCSTTREAQYTKEEFGSVLADLGWPVKRVYWNGQPVNVVEYNGVAYYANREVTPVHSSDNIDKQNGNYYTIDELHGRFEKFTSRGKHLGEYDIDGNFIKDSIDYSGKHDIIIK